MVEQRVFPEARSDPLSDLPLRTAIVVEGYTVVERRPRDVASGDDADPQMIADGEPVLFRSVNLKRSNSEFITNVFVESECNSDIPSKEESPNRRSWSKWIKAPISLIVLLAVFYFAIYTPFIRVNWIESLEEFGQDAPLASVKCAFLDLEDRLLGHGAIHPKLVRSGCTMVEPVPMDERMPSGSQTPPLARTFKKMPKLETPTHHEN